MEIFLMIPYLPKAVVLDGVTSNPGDNPWTKLEAITRLTVYDRSPADKILAWAADAEILLTNKTPLSREHLFALPKLKLIAVLATGYNVVDIAAASERGIVVCNVPTYATDSVAQHTFALLLELCHRCGDHDAAVQAGEWSRSPDFCFWKSPLIELNGKILGIAGYGRIGRRVAEMARAFGMEVQYFSRHQQREETGERFVEWEEWVATSDVLSLHCALTPESEKMINRSALERMKPSAFLINTSRGGLIDEEALREALSAGALAGAALDVLTVEPPRENALIGVPNCILTPHMAWTGIHARRTLMDTTVENVRAFLRGCPIHVVNAAATR